MLFPKPLVTAAAATLLALGSAPAFAQDAAEGAGEALDISANIGLVSDYRFRGISLSDRGPALQGGTDVSHRSGLFVGAWASTIEEYGGADTELDIYAGYAGSAAGLDYSIGAYAYIYPGGEDVNYLELQSSVSRSFGETVIGAEFAYVPEQDNVAIDNVYVGAKVESPIPGTPLSFLVRGGYEDGFYDGKLDGEAGVSMKLDRFTLSASYVATDHSGPNEAGRNARSGLVASILAEF